MTEPLVQKSDLRTALKKFQSPDITATGQARAGVRLRALETLWVNTGTLCNIECANCYIFSSPRNDRLVYIALDEVAGYLDEIEALDLGTKEIGFTGGEPFMNPQMCDMLAHCLERGYRVLVLTNAMQPMQRSRVKKQLLSLNEAFAERLTLRVSLDHYSRELHDNERGAGTYDRTIAGTRWLAENGFKLNIAGRTCWKEPIEKERAGYAALFARLGIPLDANDPSELVLFPEMDAAIDVPEITTECWSILGLSPENIMCASSRMVVKRKGAEKPAVIACTLLPYDRNFEMGSTLAQSLDATTGAIRDGEIKLNHPYCAQFCVLGGGSCSVAND